MAEMASTLNRILGHLRRLDRGAAERLQPGLSNEDLQSWESKLPFRLTREVEEMYRWRNGTHAEAGTVLQSLYFFPGFYFLSIEEAVETYENRAGGEQEWRKNWFPLFADGGGDFYIIPCTDTKVDESEVIGFLHGEPEQTAEYESLRAMLETLDACFREDAFYLDEDDTMEIDDDKHREIARRFNPTILEWQK